MMTPDELQQFAQIVEVGIRCEFQDLDCRVRPFVDTATGEPIAQLICEVHATTPPIRLVYSLRENSMYSPLETTTLISHLGTTLTQQMPGADADD